VPVLLYNFTAVTGVDLPPAAVARLTAHPNIAGMKESGGDVARVAELVSIAPGGFSVLAGSATSFYASLCVGASGGILALANVLPEPCVRLYDLVRGGRHDEARALQAQLVPLSKLLGNAYGVAGLKAALNLQGIDVGAPRLPLAPLPDAGVAALRDALARFQEVTA
jgi:4-hydroxy-2-oxoglutarate aldolase